MLSWPCYRLRSSLNALLLLQRPTSVRCLTREVEIASNRGDTEGIVIESVVRLIQSFAQPVVGIFEVEPVMELILMPE